MKILDIKVKYSEVCDAVKSVNLYVNYIYTRSEKFTMEKLKSSLLHSLVER